MDIKVIAGDITAIETSAIMVSFFEGMKQPEDELAAIDKALDDEISKLISQSEIRGKRSEITVVHTMGRLPAAHVVVVGLGKKEDLTLDRVRGAVAEACRHLRKNFTCAACTRR